MGYNREHRYGMYAAVFGRSNPDGTKPTATGGFLGFSGTVDLSGVLTSGAANLTVKLDDGTASTKSVDFTAASSQTAVTIAEAVTALTTAAFTGITWSSGTDKDGASRLKGVASSGTYIQVTGDLAAALGFGQCGDFSGNGLEVFHYVGDQELSTATDEDSQIDSQTTDEEGPMGGVTRMNIPAVRLGSTVVVTVKINDRQVRECINGGTYDRTADTYTPPTPTASKNLPVFWLETFAPQYNKSVNNLSDLNSVEKKNFWCCTGNVAPSSYDGWATQEITVNAVEYTNSSGTTVSSENELTITKDEYTALDLENV